MRSDGKGIIAFVHKSLDMSPDEESNLSWEFVDGKSRTYRFSAVIEKDKDGYFAYVPEIQGCYSQGDTYEEALKNIRDSYTPSCRGSS